MKVVIIPATSIPTRYTIKDMPNSVLARIIKNDREVKELSLKQFEKAFNEADVHTHMDFIKIID